MHITVRFLPLVALIACASQAPLAVEVQRGGPATDVALRITEAPMSDHPIDTISLDAAPGSGRNPGSAGTTIWVAAHIDGQPYLQPPVTLRVGRPLPGYTSSTAPPLVLGRYEVRVTSRGVTALTRFRVTEQNVVE